MRDLRRERRKRTPLRVVQEDEAAPVLEPMAAAEPESPGEDPAGEDPAGGSIRKALRQDLAGVFSKHPAARTLERVADVLALVLDSPLVVIGDPRIIPPISRELRAVVHELVNHQDAEDDDLFGGAGPVAVGG